MMKRKDCYIYINNVAGLLLLLIAFVAASCSTTKLLPEDEYLYTGIKSVKTDDARGGDVEAVVLDEVNSALAYAPNNSLFGSSRLRVPVPLGLWIYNGLADKPMKGFRKWAFDAFAATPRTITSAAPEMRSKVATNLLQNYGYFQGNVDYSIVDCKNPQKKKISYGIHLGPAYMVDSVAYFFPAFHDSIIRSNIAESHVAKGKQFSATDLQNERTRLTNDFHNNGLYYYRPDYINFFADSVNNPGNVSLRVVSDKETPAAALRQWRIGRISTYIRKNGSARGTSVAYDDTLEFKRLTFAYQGKVMPIKPRVMFRGFKFWTGQIYDASRVSTSLASLTSMGIFNNVQFNFTPHDTTDTCSVLDVRLDAQMDKLTEAELEFNFSHRSNQQLGPDIVLSYSKRNAFHFGETFNVKLRGAYYWRTSDRSNEANKTDSYMFGADVSLAYPWLVCPGLSKKYFRYPSKSVFSVSFLRENIASLYRLNKMSLSAAYEFQFKPNTRHTLTPISLTLLDTRNIDESLVESGAIYSAQMATVLNDEFTPAISYGFTYKSEKPSRFVNSTTFEFSLKEAGNIVSGIQAAFGRDWNKTGKSFIFSNYSQFVKFTADLRNKFQLTPQSCIATRVYLGAVIPFGNSERAPFSESFYSGGANSIRGFASRSIGPGNFKSPAFDSYLFHAGEMRFELNAEYRFPLFGSLFGAVFLDAGNVWMLGSEKTYDQETINYFKTYYDMDPSSFSTRFRFSTFFDQLALGTGFGFRYDLQFLVLRLDIGIALHAPFETSRKGYYNIPHFWKDGVAFHFAVGYPF